MGLPGWDVCVVQGQQHGTKRCYDIAKSNAFSVQSVPGMRFLAFDLAVYLPTEMLPDAWY
eukprot:1647455-Rhodomonas_salina.3